MVAEPASSGMAGRTLPNLAVAVGPNIFIYRRMRPYYKFTVPVPSTSQEEASAWEAMETGQVPLAEGVQTLASLAATTQVTPKTAELIAIEEASAQQEYVEKMSGVPLRFASSSVAAMTDIQGAAPDPASESHLVVATEDGRLLVLDASGAEVMIARSVGAAPAAIGATGTLASQPVLVYLTRGARAYVFSGPELGSQSALHPLPGPPVALVVLRDCYVVACMDESVTCYDFAGVKRYSLYTSSPILSMAAVPVLAGAGLARHLADAGVVVSCADSTVRVYRKADLVSSVQLTSPAQALAFGRYGREDNTLVSVAANGSLNIKFVPRSNPLTAGHVHAAADDVRPLDIPKKTKVFVELTQREREAATDMHRLFQRDLCKLRLTAARTFIRVLTDGKGTVSYGSGASLRMNANVMGLGPAFVVALELQNTGERSVRDLLMVLSYNREAYALEPAAIPVPLLVPGTLYSFELSVRALQPAAAPEELGVVVVEPGSPSPLLSVRAQMPPSEVLEPEEG